MEVFASSEGFHKIYGIVAVFKTAVENKFFLRNRSPCSKVTDSDYWRKWLGDKGVKAIIDTKGLLLKLTSSPNISNWVNRLDNNLDSELLGKIDDAVTSDPIKLGRLEDLFSPQKFQKPSGLALPGTHNGVNFDRNGFPDFTSFAPQPAKNYSSVPSESPFFTGL